MDMAGREESENVKLFNHKKVFGKCQTRKGKGHFEARKQHPFNTAKHFATKIGCTFCPKCAVPVAKRVTFDEKSGIVNIKKRLRMKKSIDVFFHAEHLF